MSKTPLALQETRMLLRMAAQSTSTQGTWLWMMGWEDIFLASIPTFLVASLSMRFWTCCCSSKTYAGRRELLLICHRNSFPECRMYWISWPTTTWCTSSLLKPPLSTVSIYALWMGISSKFSFGFKVSCVSKYLIHNHTSWIDNIFLLQHQSLH